jgi:MoaA/NifB/PqqE/SkfB family radical SAM enzyme
MTGLHRQCWLKKASLPCGFFPSYVPVGRKPDPQLMPTPQQRDQLRRTVAELRDTKPMLFIDFWNDGPIISGCIAGGRKYFHINANGDIEPCVFCHMAVDNIRKTSIRDALASPFFTKIREKQGAHDNLLRPCMLIGPPRCRTRDLFNGGGLSHPQRCGGNLHRTGRSNGISTLRLCWDCRPGMGDRVQGTTDH